MKMNADLKQLLSFLFPLVQCYTKHGLQTHCLYTNESSIVYFWYYSAAYQMHIQPVDAGSSLRKETGAAPVAA
jgi:hypothetical protein